MSTPKITRAVQNLFKQISRMAQSLTKGLVRWLLRGLLVIGRRSSATAGFVLPTTVLLLLMVTLTVGAIGYRTYTRSQQAIGERQQRVIYNAASPAIDRAKSKLEFMFNPRRERRFGGVPPEEQLLSMMLNDGSNNVPRFPPNGPDPYTFPDEQRIDLNNDGQLDNAWYYLADRNGDGTNDSRVVYSIIFDAPNLPDEQNLSLRDTTNATLRQRARKLMVRNAPLSNPVQEDSACARNVQANAQSTALISERGWFRDEVNQTRLRKNFQVNAYVLPLGENNTVDPNSTVAALEFQQDREASQGFRWAAWFRNDLEVFPGPQFNWNGAMHTEGSYFLSGSFRAYMVSSHKSCLYEESASELTSPNIANSSDPTIPNFQGQFVTGSLRDNNFNGSPAFDLWDGKDRPPIANRTMNSGADSLNNIGEGPIAIALDPVILQTEDVSVGRRVPNPLEQRAGTWEGGQFKARMVNLGLSTPYLDDTFRADYRYGPKPRFGYSRDPIPNQIGLEIPRDNLQLIGDDGELVGLDGYWEQRARKEGLRLIVGQRLELGDPAGWGGPTTGNGSNRDAVAELEDEPLRPWSGDCSGNRCNEMRQRRTLWDNLAAVQATAIYHSANAIDFPTACIVSTVHPGTAGTLDKSATFENLIYGFGSAFTGYQEGQVITDFFRGRGTNGWEYSLPNAGDFSNLNSPLMRALQNLAYYAGDSRGGAPSFTPIQDDFVHPLPSMAMWGDFSMLRRVIRRMQDGTSYDRLSPADKTTLHTAACTVGMLAYNIDYLNKFDVNTAPDTLRGEANVPYSNNASNDYWKGLRGHIRAIDALIYDPDTTAADDIGDPEVPATLRNTMPDAIRLTPRGEMDAMAWVQSTRSQNSADPETYVRMLEIWRDHTGNATLKDQLTKEIFLAQMLITQQQVDRDRRYGFEGAYASEGTNGSFSQQCQAWYTGQNPDQSFRVAARSEPLMRLCSDRPRYPILYSLFPIEEHGDLFDASESVPTVFRPRVRDQLDGSGRVAQYIRNQNQGIRYRVLSDDQIAAISLRPLRPPTGTTLGFPSHNGTTWSLPRVAAGTGRTPNSNRANLVKVCDLNTPCSQPVSRTDRNPSVGALFRVPFKEAAFMNGRELMSVRTLDVDLDLLRQAGTSFGNEFWLPKSGIVYAYREDAVSEAHIVRPANAAWTSCATESTLRTVGNCRMNTSSVSAMESIDPPMNPRAITTKPVDYFPDPDRRPHGFRLRNGESLWRGTSSGNTINDAADPPGRGLSFITHNPAYIQGYFNLHRPPGSDSLARNQGLEEFNQRLDDNFGNFYTRGDSGLNADFATLTKDQWRPAEIIADAVTPLSTNFCDGSIEDGLITAAPIANGNLNSTYVANRYGCSGSGSVTSYLNYNRPNGTTAETNGVKWVRSNVADSLWRASLQGATQLPEPRGESPIFIFNTGEPMWINSSRQFRKYTGTYVNMQDDKTLITAPAGIQMNMITVSGIVPSREGQSYGGLHNFPRFIENWGGDNSPFYISGAFLQLNFSTYATAPFDQEQWEPGQPLPLPGANANEWIRYYSPPGRRWGFDVAMLYAAPGPVAQRFRSPDPTRSEFYSEPPANDPYIELLANCANTPAACRATP
jgi:hypothetical protein